jgi:hypothetical protein
VGLAGAATVRSQPAHRRTPACFAKWWTATWICQMPKATVQATLGSLPYSCHLIAGADGMQRALFIQQGSAFAVLFCATIGVVLTQLAGRPLALHLAALDVKVDEARCGPPDGALRLEALKTHASDVALLLDGGVAADVPESPVLAKPSKQQRR